MVKTDLLIEKKKQKNQEKDFNTKMTTEGLEIETLIVTKQIWKIRGWLQTFDHVTLQKSEVAPRQISEDL